MSCVYWPPKSSTRIKEGPPRTSGVRSSLSSIHDPRLRSHPRALADALGALLELALRVQRGGVHDLGLLELLEVLVAGGRHAHPEGPHQVQGPVVLVGWPHQYLLERPRGPGAYAGAAREGWVEGSHTPRVAPPRRLLGFGEGAAEHHGVGPAGYGPRHVPAGAHAAVGDDVDVLAGLEVVAHPGRRSIGDGGRLRHPDPDHTPRRADPPRPDADQDPQGPGSHEVQRRRVACATTYYYGHVEGGHELHQVERLHGPRDVLGRDDRPLYDQNIEPRLYRGPVVALDP